MLQPAFIHQMHSMAPLRDHICKNRQYVRIFLDRIGHELSGPIMILADEYHGTIQVGNKSIGSSATNIYCSLPSIGSKVEFLSLLSLGCLFGHSGDFPREL